MLLPGERDPAVPRPRRMHDRARLLAKQPRCETGIHNDVASTNNMMTYINVALGVMIVIALGLIVFLLWKKQQPTTVTQQPAEDAEVAEAAAETQEMFGFLEMEDGTRHMVDSDAFLIGRHSSNDLTIADPSVSRQHAEIHRRPDGTFRITDLDSMNGVFIDNKQLKHASLKGGELLEFGDISCHFRMLSETELTGDDTMVLSNNTPDTDEPFDPTEPES